MEKIKIGELLVESNIISKEQLRDALKNQKNTDEKLGRILVKSGIISEETLTNFFAQQLGIKYIDLANYELEIAVSRKLPESQARLFRAVLLKEQSGKYLIGMADPEDILAVDEITRIMHQEIEVALVNEEALAHTLDLVYRRTGEIHNFAEKLSLELKDLDQDLVEDKETETAVSNLINSLFEDAIQVSASDIHIEPDEHILRLRQRIDGILHEQIIDEGKQIAGALSQRLKLMAGLNIAEKRLPQDGRFHIKVRNKPIDVRLSTMPNQNGESIVMRLLNQADGILNLDSIGMPAKTLTEFRDLINRPKGIILITGPTGSGKTTTLYGALNELNSVEKKIITIEDPVEYQLPRINQVQINPILDLTFARVLRTALRQDPDIILVGEIRDLETASIALRAALTGHLVLATLHTNDAASTAMRLIDMGVEGYLVASTVTAAIAQRLIRKICKSCKTVYKPTHEEINFFRGYIGNSVLGMKFHHGKGCSRCNNSGFQGRIGVYELLKFDNQMKDNLRANDANGFARTVEKGAKKRSLLANAFELAAQGITTLGEALRIAGGQD